MSSTQEHLSRDQIGWLVEEPIGQLRPPEEALALARAHLLTCEPCTRMVRMHREVQARLAGLRSQGTPRLLAGCPRPEDLRGLVSGIMATDQRTILMEHVVQCDSCSVVLRESIEDVADPTESEQEVIAKLATAQPAFQKQLAEKLSADRSEIHLAEIAPKAVAVRHSSPQRSYWLAAAAAALLAVGLVSSYLLFGKKPNPDQLLAKAYSERRSLELRLPGAAPAPVRVQRGVDGSVFAKPASLMEAELLITQELKKSPNDARWLAAKGRSELLEWQYDDAIRSFRRALETNPDALDIHRDLATAHFERAEVEHRPGDYAEAVEQLSAVLAKQPGDSVSLFNRAIVYERLFLYDNAVKDWEAYLQVDPNGPWSEEALRRLEEIKDKQKRHDQSQETPFEDPAAAAAFFNVQLHKAGAANLTIDSIDEQYLDVASTKWLRALAEDLRSGMTVPQSPYGRVLQTFSRLWQLRHSDPWLSDLLDAANEPGFPEAARTLAGSIAAASEGNPSFSLQQADLAAHQFELLHNRAGALRARLEAVYALQRSLQDEQCLQSALNLEAKLRGLGYHWMHGKLLLERAACAASTTRLEDAQRYVNASEQIAEERRFGILYLRALSFAADFAADKGERDIAWSGAHKGLEQFWKGSFPPIRGYALCASLGYLAEDSEQSWTALAFWSEALPLIKKTPNRSTEGLARYRLATDEIAVGRNGDASQELLKITQIFSSLPNNPASLNYRVASETSLAAVEATLGDSASAKKRLGEIANYISNVDQYQTVLQYYLTLGSQKMLDGDTRSAEKILRTAVAISQLGTANLAGDEDRISWDRQTSEAYRLLVRLLVSQPGREEQALRIWEWCRSAPFRSSGPGITSLHSTLRELGANPPRPNELDMRTLLPSLSNVTFLTYAELRDEIVFWAYDDRGVRFHVVQAPAEEVDRVSKRFVRLCSDPTSDVALLKADGRKLYEWLIVPEESLLSPARVVWIEPDGVLSFIPFQALTDRSGTNLLAKFSTAYRSMAAGEPRGQEPQIKAEDQALIAGSTLLAPSSPELLPLPDAQKEAEAVGARFANHRMLVADKTNPEMIWSEFRKAALFHYSGHYVSTRRKSNSLLDSFSTERAGGAVLARCKLVVLSACATASAERLGLFDPEGLLQPFLRAGARRVIASRWNVDSASTTSLMDGLYTSILSGQTTVEALRSAARKMRSDPRYSHPYYWAAFAVFARD